jgi:ZIP family zinc transporter
LQLTELNGIAGAITAGLLIALGIWPGVLIGRFAELNHATIARVTGFGAGAMIVVVAFELVAQASTEAGLGVVIPAFLAGCALFGLFNAWLARRGAKHRKRCGECVRQTSESEQPGSGVATITLSVAAGAALGVLVEVMLPEAVHGAPTFSGLIAGLGFVGLFALGTATGF